MTEEEKDRSEGGLMLWRRKELWRIDSALRAYLFRPSLTLANDDSSRSVLSPQESKEPCLVIAIGSTAKVPQSWQ
jgi:hypothetical protein